MIRNVHTRRLPVRAIDVRRALNRLGSPGDDVWPGSDWPRMQLDRGIAPGSKGGHSAIRYHVESVSDDAIVFRFDSPRGLRGTHRFEVQPDGLACVVRHIIEAKPTLRTRIAWAAVIRPIHDALIEDLLDNLTRSVGARVKTPARWTAYTRLLRRRFELGSDDLSARRMQRARKIVEHDVEVVVVGG